MKKSAITLFNIFLSTIFLDSIDLHGCMIVFAINCIIGSIFIHFILAETRFKPMDTLKSEQKQNEDTNFWYIYCVFSLNIAVFWIENKRIELRTRKNIIINIQMLE